MMTPSSSATVAVEKGTSELLISPDWTMNIDICDSVNSHQWSPIELPNRASEIKFVPVSDGTSVDLVRQAKDVVKAVKKRLQHKNSKVQLLALTLLETMVKNCGDFVHFQIAERNVLGEMVKIVKKKADMQVRDKILVLLDSWQEAFGGPGGKHPQYYWAYEDLRRYGVQFPKHSPDAAPIFTPPVTYPTLGQAEGSYVMPSNSSRRLDETMAAEVESLSLSSLDSMWDVVELLNDMLRAVNPSVHEAVKDEVIVDLVNRCRSNQKKLMQMLTTAGDEELLGRGLELNDSLQNLLAKHDAIASGSPIPAEAANLSPKPTEARASLNLKSIEVSDSSPTPDGNHPAAVASITRALIDEEEEEEDDFALLARRHSKPVPSENTSAGTGGPVNNSDATSSLPATTTATPSSALVLPDPPAPVSTLKDQDIIDLLSITLSTTSTSPQAPHTPSASNHSTQQIPTPPSAEGNPYASPQTYPGNQGQVPYISYAAPWAQPQPQLPSQPQPQLQSQPQLEPQVQQPQYSSVYPPPPWSATPGYFNGQHHLSGTTQANMPAYTHLQGAGPLQPDNSFPSRGSNGSVMHGDAPASSGSGNPRSTTAHKPFIPSYRLFEDLNVLGSADAKLNMTSSSSPSLSGTSGQDMVGGRK